MAKHKRGNHEGTIYHRKDGLWMAQISTTTGRKSLYGKTRAEVQRKMDSAKADLAKGLPLPDGHQTVKQYLEDWLEGVRTEVRSSSFLRYRTIVQKHLIPSLGRIPLTQLDAQAVKGFQRAKVKDDLSPTTIRQMHGVLHRALRDALDMRLVQYNATERVKAPRRDHKEMQALSEEAARTLLEAAKGERLKALYLLALTTGMREGELVSLHWRDVHLDTGKLLVKYNAEKTEHGYQIAETKTTYSRRTIGLTHVVIAALKAHHTQQLREQAHARQWEKNDLVFPNQQGRLLLPPNLYVYFQRVRQAAKLPPMRFHDLRHTAATIALSRGVNVKMVSEMLGHASITITLQLYGHVTPHMQQAAMDVMDAVFG
jgi:integrase